MVWIWDLRHFNQFFAFKKVSKIRRKKILELPGESRVNVRQVIENSQI